MKPGTRALGIAESTDESSGDCVFCGAVVRADRTVDGIAFATATVGGLDATDAVRDLFEESLREDVQYVVLSGIAPAWFNLLDLDALAAVAQRPVIAVSYESSPGLEPALREHFEGTALTERLETYDRLPPRQRIEVNGEPLFVRAVDKRESSGGPDAARIVRAYTPADGRPEPLRVARVAARGARSWRVRNDG
ncbi:MAG: DUF99 family protein [Halobellus sp.]|uniref:endonuclease dU n=1 Tax=Halobellus sp. TaxID=1979212 RepID=UPI0035D48C55